MKVLNCTCHPKSLKLTYSSCFLHPSLEMPRLSEIDNMQVWVHTSIEGQLVCHENRVYGGEIWRVQVPVAASTAFSASWTVLWGLERLAWRPLWPWAERTLRKRTSLALKKATMKGCFSWDPLPVTSPASRGFLLWPTEGAEGTKLMRVSTNRWRSQQHTSNTLLNNNFYMLIWPQEPQSELELCENPLCTFTKYVVVLLTTVLKEH